MTEAVTRVDECGDEETEGFATASRGEAAVVATEEIGVRRGLAVARDSRLLAGLEGVDFGPDVTEGARELVVDVAG